MRILICGAAGFLGKNLIEKLILNDNNELVLLDTFFDERCLSLVRDKKVDLVYGDSVRCLETHTFDLVFYLSCVSNPNSALSVKDEYTNNIEPLIDALDMCLSCKAKFIYFSSGGTVYGDNGLELNKEDSSLSPISSYGLQKSISEEIIKFYGNSKKMNYAVVRLANPFGKYQNPNGTVGIITKFIAQYLSSGTITVFGDGKNERDYIYVEDAIDMVCRVAFSNKNGIYNIGTGSGTSIVEIVSCLDRIMGKKVEIVFLPSRSCDVRKNVLDISKYIADFGDYAFTSLEAGILKTIDYLKIQ